LGLQIAGHPYGDATVLEIGHAYEQATAWHKRRPQLQWGGAAPQVDTAHDPPNVQADAQVQEQVAAAVRHAGLRLNDHQLALLMESAPYAIAMARNIRRDLPWQDEPAAVFGPDRMYC
jgi:aspartyl-tRNA(Asn)/glutamyl-tRNA(Gln) amidotransferase subunit A